jgi:hypothetical protein
MPYNIRSYGSQAVIDYIFEYTKQPDKENELFNATKKLWLPPKSRPKIDQNKVDHYPSVVL